MASIFDTRLPLVAAPMAGGPSTVALASAATRAGAFGFLAGGNKAVAALAAEIEQMRALGQPFGVNLFVPPRDSVDPRAFANYARRLQPEAEPYGIALDPEPRGGDDAWRGKIALLIEHPVAFVSLTFGLPEQDDIAALQRAGSGVLATVTSASEALAAEKLGVDGLIVQGFGAGGHSAVHDPSKLPEQIQTAELVRRVRAATALPLVEWMAPPQWRNCCTLGHRPLRLARCSCAPTRRAPQQRIVLRSMPSATPMVIMGPCSPEPSPDDRRGRCRTASSSGITVKPRPATPRCITSLENCALPPHGRAISSACTPGRASGTARPRPVRPPTSLHGWPVVRSRQRRGDCRNDCNHY